MPQMKPKHQLNEHLSENDLKWLVNDDVLIDMHKTKLGEDKDYIVLSIAVNDRTPAHDLARFIENSIHKLGDVEVSPATDSKGRYLVYVELERNANAYKTIEGILNDSKKLTGIKIWKFKSMGMDSYMPFDNRAFMQYVITDPSLYEQRFPHVEQNIEEPEPETQPEVAEPAEENVQESIKSRLKFLLTY
jgi:hypothetical protein